MQSSSLSVRKCEKGSDVGIGEYALFIKSSIYKACFSVAKTLLALRLITAILDLNLAPFHIVGFDS